MPDVDGPGTMKPEPYTENHALATAGQVAEGVWQVFVTKEGPHWEKYLAQRNLENSGALRADSRPVSRGGESWESLESRESAVVKAQWTLPPQIRRLLPGRPGPEQGFGHPALPALPQDEPRRPQGQAPPADGGQEDRPGRRRGPAGQDVSIRPGARSSGT